jgi:hypothetical protein
MAHKKLGMGHCSIRNEVELIETEVEILGDGEMITVCEGQCFSWNNGIVVSYAVFAAYDLDQIPVSERVYLFGWKKTGTQQVPPSEIGLAGNCSTFTIGILYSHMIYACGSGSWSLSRLRMPRRTLHNLASS